MAQRSFRSPLKLVLATLGVVYGDIGTSPLYAVRECFDVSGNVMLSSGNILGILSLIFWALTLVVAVKYLTFVLRADNQGEGGIMALTAMLQPKTGEGTRYRMRLVTLGLFGAALLFGDGMITPAISVLSAVEGLEVAAPALTRWVVPLTIGILILLFAIQNKGTARVGAWFGPIISTWFIVIAVIGVPWIIRRPEVLLALNPLEGLRFFRDHGWHSFHVLSGVVLCITGAEALYADMGHFGVRPIRLGWFTLVFPALILNYLGQGALLLEQGQTALANPFFSLVSGPWRYPLSALATLATVIASQALISGTYSLTQQAIHLGYLPRTEILHTSRETAGQIYIPRANQILMVGCILLVLIFEHASALASAYGIAVTGTMLVTSILFLAVTRDLWNWTPLKSWPLVGTFLLIDCAFLVGNIGKIPQGGWIPFLIGGGVFTIMITWHSGRELLSNALRSKAQTVEQFCARLPVKKPIRVKGTAVFMNSNEGLVPHVLLHHMEHTHVLHERVILLTIRTERQPYVPERNRVRIEELPWGLFRIVASYGYMQKPDISEILIYCLSQGLELKLDELAFVVGRERLLPTGRSGLKAWQKRLFVLLSRNARPVTDYFGLPHDQVIEIGMQIEI